MPIAKCILANDVIEGLPTVLGGTGDVLTVAVDDTKDYAQHFVDPTGTNLNAIVGGRWLAGVWTEERNVNAVTTSDVSTPAVGAEANVTYAAVPYKQHTIFGMSFSYNAPTNGSGILTVEAGSGNIVFSKLVPSTTNAVQQGVEDSQFFDRGLRVTRGSSLIVRLTGVAGARGQLSVLGYRTE